MLTADRENLLAVMRLLDGEDEEVAAERLARRVFISVAEEASAQAFADNISALLERSLSVVTILDQCEVEVAVGTNFKSQAPTRIHLALSSEALVVSLNRVGGAVEANVHGLFRKIAACYVAGNVIARAIAGPQFDFLRDTFQVNFSAFGVSQEKLRRPIALSGAVVAGAGGVANGLFWGFEELDISGEVTICDPKAVSAGNLNRCLYFSEDNIGSNKAEVLAGQVSSSQLLVKPFAGTFSQFVKQIGNVRRVFTTVDSRPARRVIQGELPAEVLDASTTDLSAVVVHSHRQPADGACLGCIYAHIPVEDQRKKHIAEGLGITEEEAGQAFIDITLANKLGSIHSGLQPEKIIGKSLDTLYKEQCGQGALLTAAGEQAIAPLAFISNLAGLLLALELVRFEASEGILPSSYMSLDPWRPPTLHARRNRSRNPDCAFCAKPFWSDAIKLTWPDLFSGN
jgi:molybdopterin/thiamine biosynthesis adenylyltransferase